MAKEQGETLSRAVIKGHGDRINYLTNTVINADLNSTEDKGIIVRAINKGQRDLTAEKVAIVGGSVAAAITAVPVTISIIKLIEDKPFGLNGLLIGVAAIAILCGFVIKRIRELKGLERYIPIATTHVEEKAPELNCKIKKLTRG